MTTTTKNPLVAVASGKGGTGKTTVAVNLAAALAAPVQLLDCDVEAPNAHLFLQTADTGAAEETVCMPVPRVDEARCDGCGECARFCAYRAIACFGAKPLIFPEMCHGCGGCQKVCPRGAISEEPRRIGVIRTGQAGQVRLETGRLDVGVPMAPPLIRALKKHRDHTAPCILDAPPGNACPMVACVRGADLVLLVTEPTPFGLHDLKLAVATIRQLALPCGIVLNRAGSGDNGVADYCAAEKLPLLLEIPDDRRVAEAYSRGLPMVAALPEYRPIFMQLWAEMRRAIQKKS